MATAFDAPVLAKLRYVFRLNFHPERESFEDETLFVERCAAWMRERLEQPSAWLCLVAESNGLIVGQLWIQFFDKVPNPVSEPERHAYITSFYVVEEERGRGVGSMLLSNAVQWCETEKAHLIILWSTGESRPLYLRNGFAANEKLLERVM